MNDLHSFAGREALYTDITDRLATALRAAIEARGKAFMALSGGSTPGPIYERLSNDGSVDWTKVTVTLVDERLTKPGDPASNERMVRDTLLTHRAGAASFLPMEEGCRSLPVIDTAVLGMGGDGHFASLFPTADELDAGLSADAPDVLRMTPNPLPENAPFPRLTLSLRKINEVRSLILVITGTEKKQVFGRARTDGPVRELPIRSLLALHHPNLFIAWAP